MADRTAELSREAARKSTGQFGAQHHTAPEVTLGGDAERVSASVRTATEYVAEHPDEMAAERAAEAAAGRPAVFVANRKSGDPEQARPYFDSYSRFREEMVARGDRILYNDNFRGRIEGLEGSSPRDEDTAIFWLQNLHRKDAEQVKEKAFIESGGVELTPEEVRDGTPRRGTFVHRDFYVGGNGWIEHSEARLVSARGAAWILPKGKRTNGHLVHGRILFRPDKKS